jgi:hypothetical protein
MARQQRSIGDEATDARDGADQAHRVVNKNDSFHLLQNSRRRAVIRYFAAVDGPVQLGEMATQIAAWECDVALEDVTEEQRQRVYIALYQSHLDKLDDHDVVDYESASGTVSTGPNYTELRQRLDHGTEPATAATATASPERGGTGSGRLWAGCYLGIALGGVLPVALQFQPILPRGLISLEVLNVVLVAACLVVATVHYRDGV